MMVVKNILSRTAVTVQRGRPHHRPTEQRLAALHTAMAGSFWLVVADWLLTTDKGQNVKRALLYVWQLPQNLLVLLVKLITKPERFADYYIWRLSGGVSLGRYIFVSSRCSLQTVQHERGHQKQSLMLGPLYLFIIGLPSFLWATLKAGGLFKKTDYYSFYTEKWADRLGGVKR